MKNLIIIFILTCINITAYSQIAGGYGHYNMDNPKKSAHRLEIKVGMYNFTEDNELSVNGFDELRDLTNASVNMNLHGNYWHYLDIFWGVRLMNSSRNQMIVGTSNFICTDLIRFFGVESNVNKYLDINIGYKGEVFWNDFVNLENTNFAISESFSRFSHGPSGSVKFRIEDSVVKPFAEISYFHDIVNHAFIAVNNSTNEVISINTSNSQINVSVGITLLIQ